MTNVKIFKLILMKSELKKSTKVQIIAQISKISQKNKTIYFYRLCCLNEPLKKTIMKKQKKIELYD